MSSEKRIDQMDNSELPEFRLVAIDETHLYLHSRIAGCVNVYGVYLYDSNRRIAKNGVGFYYLRYVNSIHTGDPKDEWIKGYLEAANLEEEGEWKACSLVDEIQFPSEHHRLLEKLSTETLADDFVGFELKRTYDETFDSFYRYVKTNGGLDSVSYLEEKIPYDFDEFDPYRMKTLEMLIDHRFYGSTAPEFCFFSTLQQVIAKRVTTDPTPKNLRLSNALADILDILKD